MFSGGADNAGRMFDVATGQATQVAQHDMPIKAVRWIDAPQAGILATASWDKTIKVRHLPVSTYVEDDERAVVLGLEVVDAGGECDVPGEGVHV